MQIKRLTPIVMGLMLSAAAAMAQTITYEDQLHLVAPTISGETGLFTTVTGQTLAQGDWSFGIYLNDYDQSAGPAPEFALPSARRNRPFGYDLNRLSASIGYGLTDRWEFAASIPWDHIYNNGRDRAGFVNGYLYQGRFTDSGAGDLHLSTKIGLTPVGATSNFAMSLFVDVPTGDDKGGISTGNANWGVGAHWNGGVGAFSATYKITGDRDANKTPLAWDRQFNTPDEFHLDGGVNLPIGFWRTTNWISEVNATVYTGGERRPSNPVYLVSGIRHWFGTSGWALNAGVRWNAAYFTKDHKECRATELDDCGFGGLVGLTYAPLHLAPPPPAAPAAPPEVPPAAPPSAPPVTPPQPPIAQPHVPSTLRTDEIHFEPGSARLTNIAKAILDDVALRMKQETNATAVVIGYTDNKESTGANADLDRRRAEAVRDYLVSRHGIDPSRIAIEAHGTEDAVGDNSTAEGRLKNRRVVIRLMIP